MRERREAQAVGRGLHGKEDAGRRGGRVGEFDNEIWRNSFQSNRSSGCTQNHPLIKISAFDLVPRSSLEVCLTWMSLTHTHREESCVLSDGEHTQDITKTEPLPKDLIWATGLDTVQKETSQTLQHQARMKRVQTDNRQNQASWAITQTSTLAYKTRTRQCNVCHN